MSIEKLPHANEPEKRRRELSEEERKAEIAKRMDFERRNDRLSASREKDEELAYLRSLVERGLLRPATAERIMAGEELRGEEVLAILDKIDDIEAVTGIDDILPASLRIGKEEYLLALGDDAARAQVLAKLDHALTYLFRGSTPVPIGALGLFSELFGFFSARNKTVARVQGNLIDVKRSLE